MTTLNADSSASQSDILIVAAEASSGLYARRLLEHWQQSKSAVNAFGIGNRAMEELGFEVIGRSEDLAVVGLQEVLKHYGEIRKTFYDLVELAKARRPKVALLLDYPDFNLRLAKKLKKLGIPVVYYISPQVWAWRQGRVKQIKKVVDKMLVLFPFEEEFYQQRGVSVEFVGHPLLDELDDKFFDSQYFTERRQRYGVQPGEVLLALMPGSRRSELGHHLSMQLQVANKLSLELEKLKVALLVAPSLDLEEVRAQLPQLDFGLILIQDDPLEMIHLADVVLSASGTATLLVGLMQKPLVIMYRMNPFTAWVAKAFVKSVSYFGMINLVLGKEVAPEFFQEQASVENLSQALSSLIVNKDRRQEMARELRVAKHKLGNKGATVRVAEALTPYLELT